MQSLYISEKLNYDGSQLHSLFAYLNHKVLGPSIIAWQGPCSIPFEHMADGEDLIAQEKIEGSLMLHFIVEIFDRDLFSGVGLQRLFASICKDWLTANSSVLKSGAPQLHRSGDDIYLGDAKLSISIAAKSPVSVMIHFAMNISNAGTPVKTLSLEDLKVEPKTCALEVMELFKKEFTGMIQATQKVRPIS